MSAITVRNEGGRRVARRTEVISGQRIRDEGGRDLAKRSCQLKRKVLREGKVLHLGGGVMSDQGVREGDMLESGRRSCQVSE